MKRPVRSSVAAGSRWSGPWNYLARKHTRARTRPLLEVLESRTLLSTTITEYLALSSGGTAIPRNSRSGPMAISGSPNLRPTKLGLQPNIKNGHSAD